MFIRLRSGIVVNSAHIIAVQPGNPGQAHVLQMMPQGSRIEIDAIEYNYFLEIFSHPAGTGMTGNNTPAAPRDWGAPPQALRGLGALRPPRPVEAGNFDEEGPQAPEGPRPFTVATAPPTPPELPRMGMEGRPRGWIFGYPYIPHRAAENIQLITTTGDTATPPNTIQPVEMNVQNGLVNQVRAIQARDAADAALDAQLFEDLTAIAAVQPIRPEMVATDEDIHRIFGQVTAEQTQNALTQALTQPQVTDTVNVGNQPPTGLVEAVRQQMREAAILGLAGERPATTTGERAITEADALQTIVDTINTDPQAMGFVRPLDVNEVREAVTNAVDRIDLGEALTDAFNTGYHGRERTPVEQAFDLRPGDGMLGLHTAHAEAAMLREQNPQPDTAQAFTDVTMPNFGGDFFETKEMPESLGLTDDDMCEEYETPLRASRTVPKSTSITARDKKSKKKPWVPTAIKPYRQAGKSTTLGRSDFLGRAYAKAYAKDNARPAGDVDQTIKAQDKKPPTYPVHPVGNGA